MKLKCLDYNSLNAQLYMDTTGRSWVSSRLNLDQNANQLKLISRKYINDTFNTFFSAMHPIRQKINISATIKLDNIYGTRDEK